MTSASVSVSRPSTPPAASLQPAQQRSRSQPSTPSLEQAQAILLATPEAASASSSAGKNSFGARSVIVISPPEAREEDLVEELESLSVADSSSKPPEPAGSDDVVMVGPANGGGAEAQPASQDAAAAAAAVARSVDVDALVDGSAGHSGGSPSSNSSTPVAVDDATRASLQSPVSPGVVVHFEDGTVEVDSLEVAADAVDPKLVALKEQQEFVAAQAAQAKQAAQAADARSLSLEQQGQSGNTGEAASSAEAAAADGTASSNQKPLEVEASATKTTTSWSNCWGRCRDKKSHKAPAGAVLP